MTSLDPAAKAVPRAMPLGGPPNRVIYSTRLEVLIVAMSLRGKSTIAIVNPETGKDVGRSYDAAGDLLSFPSGLGVRGDTIQCMVEWELKTSSTTTNLLVIGTTSGSLLMYKLEKEYMMRPIQDRTEVRCVPFLKEQYDAQVWTIACGTTSFVICVGETLRWASWDESENKILTRAEYYLPSPATSITVEGHWVFVLTERHSLITLLLGDKKKHPHIIDAGHGQFLPQFSDEVRRLGLSQILLTNEYEDYIGKNATLVMVSDKDDSVSGFWQYNRWQYLVRSHDNIFEASLPASTMKFLPCKTRPLWDRSWKSNGDTSSVVRPMELLGMGLDGSLRHFMILKEKELRLLRFIQDLTHETEFRDHWSIPLHVRNKYDARKKHVNGDILRPILNSRTLEYLLMAEGNRAEVGIESRVIEDFCTLVHDLRGRQDILSQQDKETGLENCLEEAYRVMAHFLRPVF